MGFLKALGRGAKRLARSKLLQGAMSAATGGLSDKVVSVGKSIGAATSGGKMLKRQAKAVTHAAEKIQTIPTPSVKNTAGGVPGDKVWVPKAKAKRKKTVKPDKDGNLPHAHPDSPFLKKTGKKGKPSAAKSSPPKKKPARGSKATGSGRKPPKPSAATKKKFAANAEAMRKKGAQWKKMTDAQKKAAGGWKSFAFGG